MSNNQEDDFQIGDEVHLSSGGPIMTIKQISEDGKELTCRWFDKTQNLKTEAFDRGELKKKSDEPPFRIVTMLP